MGNVSGCKIVCVWEREEEAAAATAADEEEEPQEPREIHQYLKSQYSCMNNEMFEFGGEVHQHWNHSMHA